MVLVLVHVQVHLTHLEEGEACGGGFLSSLSSSEEENQHRNKRRKTRRRCLAGRRRHNHRIRIIGKYIFIKFNISSSNNFITMWLKKFVTVGIFRITNKLKHPDFTEHIFITLIYSLRTLACK
jgi:hypothetical protein